MGGDTKKNVTIVYADKQVEEFVSVHFGVGRNMVSHRLEDGSEILIPIRQIRRISYRSIEE